MHNDDDVELKVAVCKARAKALGGDMVIFGAREGMELRIDR